MKIGIFISPRHRVPPNEEKILAPWYLAQDLVNGLVDLKHEVYLFAAKGSKTSGHLFDYGIEPTFPMKTKLNAPQYKEYVKRKDQLMLSQMIDTAKEKGIHVIHINQLDYVYEVIFEAPKNIQFVFTLHDPINEEKYKLLDELNTLPNCHFVSISNSQRRNYPFRFIDTVYNGIRLSDWPYTESPADYLLHVGRLVPEKGLYHAINVALKMNMRLEIGTEFPNGDTKDVYFLDKIKPFLTNPMIGEPGMVKGKEKQMLYQMARILLFPIEWEEPFGLVMIEAMASGTPVIAFARGSVPEVMVDGVTGYVVNQSDDTKRGDFLVKTTGETGLMEAMSRINGMTPSGYSAMRKACRDHVENSFSTQKMVKDYLSVYQRLLK